MPAYVQVGVARIAFQKTVLPIEARVRGHRVPRSAAFSARGAHRRSKCDCRDGYREGEGDIMMAVRLILLQSSNYGIDTVRGADVRCGHMGTGLCVKACARRAAWVRRGRWWLHRNLSLMMRVRVGMRAQESPL